MNKHGHLLLVNEIENSSLLRDLSHDTGSRSTMGKEKRMTLLLLVAGDWDADDRDVLVIPEMNLVG